MSNGKENPLALVLASLAHNQTFAGQTHGPSTRSSPRSIGPRKADQCALCRAKDVRLMRCKRCATTSYCSVTCQRLDWSDHKRVCAKLLDMRVAPKNRATVTLQLANRVQRCDAEMWLQMLAVTLLDLIARPGREETHALLLRWDLVPVMSLREYRENTRPRERFNDAGEQRYMLALKDVTMEPFENLRGSSDQPQQSDYSSIRERRAHETLPLDEGEPDYTRVAVLNFVDSQLDRGKFLNIDVLRRRMLIRHEMLDLTRDIETEELPVKRLPGENMAQYCIRVVNELICKDTHNKWKLRTYLPLQDDA